MEEKRTRLNKAIAARGNLSRRKADELILGGKVTVNGLLEKNPATRVHPSDVLAIAGSTADFSPPACTIMLNKPIHCVCTRQDPQKRKTVMELLPREFANLGLYPVGRLDYFSEGLLLLTNDGDLAMRLMHPRYHQPRFYEVMVRENVGPEMLAQMREGMELEQIGKILPVKAELLQKRPALLKMELRQGLNRQIRRMCAELGLTILRLRRTGLGPLRLGSLPSGQCRRLTSDELAKLAGSIHASPS